MTVTKLDLSKRLTKKLPVDLCLPFSLTIESAKTIVETVVNEIFEILAQGDKIEIRGFGVFCVKKRKARVGRNPRTGAIVTVPESIKPVFKFSKEAQKRIETSQHPQ